MHPHTLPTSDLPEGRGWLGTRLLMAVVCSHLLVHNCVRYTNSSCKMNTLTHMADYISLVQVEDGVWPEVQWKVYM